MKRIIMSIVLMSIFFSILNCGIGYRIDNRMSNFNAYNLRNENLKYLKNDNKK